MTHVPAILASGAARPVDADGTSRECSAPALGARFLDRRFGPGSEWGRYGRNPRHRSSAECRRRSIHFNRLEFSVEPVVCITRHDSPALRRRARIQTRYRWRAPTYFTLNPAVQPPQCPEPGLMATISNCCVDHLLGDNPFSRKQLRPKGGGRGAGCQPPDFGSLILELFAVARLPLRASTPARA